jgi:WD40 repeat protein
VTRIDSPYKGLAPFEDSELDALLFFGRERDSQVIEANLVASRLTVLYGPSGVGKSSVVRAAVARGLRALPEAPLVVVWADWGREPAASLAAAVAEAAHVPANSLAETVERAQQERQIYMILDQAEEYFVYHGANESFARALAETLERPLRANVLLVVRADALAELDRFRKHLPDVFANVVQLGRLDRAAGRAAIVRPVARFAELTGEPVEVEPALVERVLDEVTAGRIGHGFGGEGVLVGAATPGAIETPYLQLVMQRVWDAERDQDSRMLRCATLDRLGGAREIVSDNLERAMAELAPEQRSVAATMFTHLVTPSGQRVAHRAADLGELAGVSEDEAMHVLRPLDERRILRSGEGGAFEIFHDVLASEVLDWRRRFAADEALERQRREASRRHRLLLLITAAALVAAVAATALTIWALVERGNASQQARRAKARELDASAIALLPSDPELGMLLATEAARLSPTLSAEDVLRRTILADHLVQSFPMGDPVTDIAVSGRRVAAGTTAGTVEILVRRNGAYESERSMRLDGRVRQVAVSADAAAAGTAGGRVTLVTPSPTISRSYEAPLSAVVLVRGCSSDGCLVVASRRELHVVDVATGTQVRRIALPSPILEVVTVRANVVATRSADPFVRVVDVRTGRVRTLKAGRPADSLAADPRLVAAGLHDGTVRVWDASTGRLDASSKPHVKAVLALAVSNGLVVSGSASGGVQVWDPSTGLVVAPPGGHNNLVVAADLTPDGAYALSASLDRTAKVWRTADGHVASELVGHRDAVRDAAFVDDGRQVVTGSADGTVGIWDADTAPDLRVTRAPAPSPPRTRASTDGGAVAVARGNTVLLRLPSGESFELRGHRDRVTSVAFNDDGTRLVTASRDHDARVWDARTGELSHVLTGHFGAVQDARFSPDGRWVVTAGPITAGLWNARTGELVRYLRGPTSALIAAAFTDNDTIVTSEADGSRRQAGCTVCGELPALLALADARLGRAGRQLTPQEREQYLG